MRRARVMRFGVFSGLAVAILTTLLLGVTEGLPRDGTASRFIRAVHYPEGWRVQLLTDGWFPGNADMGITVRFFLHPLYWMAIGAALAWAYVLVRGRSQKRA